MRASSSARRRTVYTVGHSNRGLEEFLELLVERGVEIVVDVRRWPTSRKFPHFNRESLEKALREAGIGYEWLGEELGGYRKGGYESYMKSEEFERGLEKLVELASRKIVAVMCSEKLWFRCHRRFISDALTARGFRVVHIVEKGRLYEHRGRRTGSEGSSSVTTDSAGS